MYGAYIHTYMVLANPVHACVVTCALCAFFGGECPAEAAFVSSLQLFQLVTRALTKSFGSACSLLRNQACSFRRQSNNRVEKGRVEVLNVWLLCIWWHWERHNSSEAVFSIPERKFYLLLHAQTLIVRQHFLTGTEKSMRSKSKRQSKCTTFFLAFKKHPFLYMCRHGSYSGCLQLPYMAYIWWFLCQSHRINTVCMWFWPTLNEAWGLPKPRYRCSFITSM